MLVGHSALFLGARLAAALVGLATTVILTRLLDPAAYGAYGLALVVTALTSNIAYDWLQLAFARLGLTSQQSPKVISTFVLLFIALVAISALVVIVVLEIRLFSRTTSLTIMVGVILGTSFSWFELAARYEAINIRPFNYFIMIVSRAALAFIGATGAALLTADPIWTVIGAALGTLVAAIFTAIMGGFPSGQFRVRDFDRKFANRIVSFGLPLCASMILDGLVSTGVRIQVELFNSSEGLGHYTVAFLLVQNLLVAVGAAIASAGYSLVVRAVESGDSALIYRQLVANGTLLFATMAPASIGLALTSEGIATTFSGPEFAPEVAKLIPWMAVGTFFLCIRGGFLDHAFQLGHRTILQIWVAGVAAVLANGLSLFLVPRFGPVGAAMAFAITMPISCCHAYVLGRRAFRLSLPIGPILKIALCCGFMAILVRSIPGQGAAALATQVAIGLLGYAGAAFAMNLLNVRSLAFEYLSEKTRSTAGS